MKIKICGITDVKSALYAVQQGADALGFVFTESKREITTEKARKIIVQLPEHILKVGVFVNQTEKNIKMIVEETGITAIQLHGDESPDFCKAFTLPVIKAVSINSQEDLVKIGKYDCEYLLLDSPAEKYRGGNGITFDWTLLKGEDLLGKKLILAGGLHADNVREAIRIVRPNMVDVSSGVETEGRKDLLKIKRFIERAKNVTKEEVI